VNATALGLLLLTKRRELGLRQSEAAARFGIGQQTLSKWELGTLVPDVDVYGAALAKYLSISRARVQLLVTLGVDVDEDQASDLIDGIRAQLTAIDCVLRELTKKVDALNTSPTRQEGTPRRAGRK
jgi:transcriptional regulator with XRE-family HTH domain